jgi:geranylgeranyl diphosphate synthase type II
VNAEYDRYKEMIEKALEGLFGDSGKPYSKLLKSMRYSLLAGGKRIRPILVLEFCRASGGDPNKAIPLACAVEMLHTYSLIHDDLPCMDDDNLRRGKPTNHMIFGEAAAVLAGDALQAEAFYTILSAPYPADIRSECARLLAEAAGSNGICGGQLLDLEDSPKTEDQLNIIHEMKTSSLIRAACLIGAVAGEATPEQRNAAAEFASSLGLAFQIRDDILDETGSDISLGKPAGSDIRDGKTTFMSLLGEEKCKALIHALTRKAKDNVSLAFEDSAFLCSLADCLAERIR